MSHNFSLDELKNLSAEELRVAEQFQFLEHIFMMMQSRASEPPSQYAELLEPEVGKPYAHSMAIGIRPMGKIRRENERALPAVVESIRFLATRTSTSKVLKRHLRRILDARHNTSVLEEDIFSGTDEDFTFVRAVESALEGDLSGLDDARRIAKSVVSTLRVPSGPKMSLESHTHQWLLEETLTLLGKPCAYKRNPIEDRYVDRATIATQKEFSKPNFSPRSTYNRIKRNLKKFETEKALLKIQELVR